MMHLDKEVLEKTIRATPEGLAMAVEMPTSLPLQALMHQWPHVMLTLWVSAKCCPHNKIKSLLLEGGNWYAAEVYTLRASSYNAAHLLSSKTPPELPAKGRHSHSGKVRAAYGVCSTFQPRPQLSKRALKALSVSLTWINGCICLDYIFDGDTSHAWHC